MILPQVETAPKIAPRLRTQLHWLLAFALAFVSIGVKLSLTSGPLLPGLDGAYYWVQVRALLERGTLGKDAQPEGQLEVLYDSPTLVLLRLTTP